MTSMYWANEEPTKLLQSLTERIDQYYNYIFVTVLPMWRQSYVYYNQAAFTSGQLQIAGANNEYVKMGVNHYRNLIEHAVTMALSQRPAWEPRAINSDSESQKQTIIARGLLDYYMREKRLERILKQTMIYASMYGEGFITVGWNATDGEVYATDPETKIEQKSGDIEYNTYGPIDVVRSCGLFGSADSKWYIVRDHVNKWDLVAKWAKGDNADKIKSAIMGSNREWDPKSTIFSQKGAAVYDPDMTEVFKFYHDRTDSVPDGRYTMFVRDVVLQDGPLPSRKMPVYRMAPSELESTPFGYTANFDLLSIQQMLDILYSTLSTQQAAFGIQSIVSPRQANTTISEVRDGMKLVEYDPSDGPPPQGLNLLADSPSTYNFITMLERVMETLSGVNSVARGNPESSLKSGAALALVQSMAVQFMMGLQASYVQLLEDVGTATISDLRDYAAVPRVAMIAGKGNRPSMLEFSSKDLSTINRVQVDAGNPMMKTVAGKTELATMMLQNQLISTPDELLQVIQTGNLDPLVEGKTNELLGLRRENEQLQTGEPVIVLFTDNHALHIQEHKCLLSDPIARSNPDIVNSVTQHIQQHLDIMRDPNYADVLALLGQQSLAQPSQAALQQTGKMAQETNAAQEGANQLAAQMQPSMPKNPIQQ